MNRDRTRAESDRLLNAAGIRPRVDWARDPDQSAYDREVYAALLDLDGGLTTAQAISTQTGLWLRGVVETLDQMATDGRAVDLGGCRHWYAREAAS